MAQHNLAEIAGLPAVSLQPAAGAHGEMTALLVAAAYFRDRHEKRTTVLIPDAAHGTNPASATMAGFRVVTVKSTPEGFVDVDDLAAKLNAETAVFMITNPNTLGLFEPQIEQIAKMVHDAGGLVYLDGANMNAILGITRPGDFGADLMHFNPHKTFSGPHGGGGPVRARSPWRNSWPRFCPCRWWSKTAAATISTTPAQVDRPGADASSATSACWCGCTATSVRTGRTACGRSPKMRCSMRITCCRG